MFTPRPMHPSRVLALAAGEQFYWTGEPCIHGISAHWSDRQAADAVRGRIDWKCMHSACR